MKKTGNFVHFPPEKWKKIFIVMNLKLIILLGLVSNLAANPMYSQSARFKVKFENQPIVSVLDRLKSMTGYEFFYQKGVIEKEIQVSGTFSDATIEQILDKVLKTNGYSYEIEGNVVLVNKMPEKVIQKTGSEVYVVKGHVIGTDKQPVIGASVIIEKTTFGTSTGVEGEFSLQVPSREGKLVVSSIGYKTKIVTYQVDKPLKVILENNVEEMEEVVVTGIFNRPRESYTGSVKTVTTKELKAFRGQNMLTTLRNIDPSINISNDNLAGSNPNRDLEVTIRGNSSLPMSLEELETTSGKMLNAPLVIMDGFEVSLQKLMDFNDEEVESINILKDASATAIYGSRGANGVIVIETKDPQPGKLKVFLQAGLNFEIPDLSSYNLMGAEDKLKLERMVGLYDATTPYEDMRLKELYNSRMTDALMGETEWIREPVRLGIGRRLNLRLEGGSEQFRWSVSLGNNLVKGAMKGSERNTTSASITLNYNYKSLKFRNVASLDMYKADNGMYGNFSKYAALNTYFRAKDEEGKIIKSWAAIHGTDIQNPLNDVTLGGKDYKKETTIRDIFSIDWQIVGGLNLKGQIGLSKSFNSRDYYLPAGHSSFSTTSDYFSKGTYDYTTGESLSVDGNFTLNYSTTIREKHTIYAGLYASIIQNKSFDYVFQTQGLLNPNFSDFTNALSYKTGTVPSGNDNRTASVGFTGNINYTYDSRYYIDGSFRVDGSSQFGAKSRYAPFWSVGVGWNIHNEKFMAGQSLFNTLRLRLSTGESGSQQFSAYQARSMYNFTVDSRYLVWTSAELMGIGNEDLTWQTTSQWNGGVDLQMMDGRITAGMDVFYKKTKDLLSAIDIKQAHGFSSYAENVGSTENYGYEAMLGVYLVRNTESRIMWNVTGKLAYTKNKVLKLSDDIKRQVEEQRKTSEYGRLLYEGKSQNSIYAVRSLGIDPIDGNELFLDDHGNVTKTWNAAYRVYCGVAEPTYRGTLSSLFSWENLSLNLSFAFHWGGVQYNNTLIDKVEVQTGTGYYTQVGMKNNVDKRVYTDRWQKPGDVKFFKGYSDESTRSSTRFVMDDNVFELQSLSLQYRWNSPFVQRHLCAETVNVSLNMSDLFYLSSIKRERGLNYPFANNVQIALSVIF